MPYNSYRLPQHQKGQKTIILCKRFHAALSLWHLLLKCSKIITAVNINTFKMSAGAKSSFHFKDNSLAKENVVCEERLTRLTPNHNLKFL